LVRPVQPHRARATDAALAFGLVLGKFQDGHTGVSVTVWHGSSLSDDDCQLVSTTSRTCVGRPSYSNHGDRCFAAAGL